MAQSFPRAGIGLPVAARFKTVRHRVASGIQVVPAVTVLEGLCGVNGAALPGQLGDERIGDVDRGGRLTGGLLINDGPEGRPVERAPPALGATVARQRE